MMFLLIEDKYLCDISIKDTAVMPIKFSFKAANCRTVILPDFKRNNLKKLLSSAQLDL